jgi:transposase
MDYVGIDAHQRSSQVCITNGVTGEVTHERIATTVAELRRVFAGRTRCRILIEASTSSEWIARLLESLGHEVIVADPNFGPMYAHRSSKVKTDRRDAEALMIACRLGAYRLAHRRSDRERAINNLLSIRDHWVRMRSKSISLVRSLARQRGLSIGSCDTAHFVERVRNGQLPDEFSTLLESTLKEMEKFNEVIADLDQKIAELGENNDDIALLQSAPRIGPVTSAAVVAMVGDPMRFKKSKQVSACVGLTPREYSSGDKPSEPNANKGPITKIGDDRVRRLLVGAAYSIMRSKTPDAEPLRQWALRVAERKGRRIAAVALARRLVGILWRMLQSKTKWDPHKLVAVPKTPATAPLPA